MCCDTKPKVTIVVPCFNAQDDLRRSVGSLLEQSYMNIEIVIVDDFSTDKSFAVASSLMAEDPRVIAEKASFKGANFARQLGVDLGSGEFLMFLDADDYWDTNAVSRLVDAASTTGADIVCCGMTMISASGESSLFQYEVENVAVDLHRDPRSILAIPPTACSKIFRMSLLKGVSFENVPFAQDWNVTYKAVARAKSVSFINDPLYKYVRRVGSTSSLLRQTSCEELISAEPSIYGIVDWFKTVGRSVTFDSAITTLFFRFYSNMLVRSYGIDSGSGRSLFLSHLRRVFKLSELFSFFCNERALRDRVKVIYFFALLYVPGLHGSMGAYYKRKAKN